MTLPSSGAVSLSQIQAEFGGSNPISLSEYYGGGAFVPPGITGSGGAIPASGSPQLMSRFRDNGFRGIAAGGIEGGSTNLAVATYLNIVGISNATFGNMTAPRWGAYSFGSSTRFVACGGISTGDAYSTSCETTLFANSGSFSGFGSTASAGIFQTSTGSNRTRGINMGGFDGSAYNQSTFIGYKDLTTSGGTNSFGLLNVSRGKIYGGASSPTRVYAILGSDSYGADIFSMEYVTTATTGNATVYPQTDPTTRAWHACLSSSTRAIYGGGFSPVTIVATVATIRYFEMSTSSATAAFGNLTQARSDVTAMSGGTRGIFLGGGTVGSTRSAVIDYINIASAGNAASFGSLANAATAKTGAANGHGGLM